MQDTGGDLHREVCYGMTAASDLRLTTAVPGRVVVHTNARRRTICLGNLEIEFKLTAPSRLYWAGRPAMRVVQALHWLKDLLRSDSPRRTTSTFGPRSLAVRIELTTLRLRVGRSGSMSKGNRCQRWFRDLLPQECVCCTVKLYTDD